jgi:hypothetical protein
VGEVIGRIRVMGLIGKAKKRKERKGKTHGRASQHPTNPILKIPNAKHRTNT